ncbi:hypothetical protein TNCT_65231 [Trichonephila clavata]|uniref:Uncharacterized protein n=1 Tax=Trichonephila clavata TaxID=2740835 RepID=A0A8X6GTQ6_TRICU|nr:hypothetical protein TNCT_65231 [Trichonephila clavata]
MVTTTLSMLRDVLDGRLVPLRRLFCALSYPEAIKASATGTMKSRSGFFRCLSLQYAIHELTTALINRRKNTFCDHLQAFRSNS